MLKKLEQKKPGRHQKSLETEKKVLDRHIAFEKIKRTMQMTQNIWKAM